MISIHYSNYKSHLDTHSKAVTDYCENYGVKFKLSKLDGLVNKYFKGIISNFKNLVEASPDKLIELKEHFDSLTKGLTDNQIEDIKKEVSVLGLYTYFRDDNLKSNYNSSFLATNIDVFTCPYCNENYTYNFSYVKNKKHSIRRTFDWDHFYPHSEYPFLAISFFNLIPCCKVCNQLKLDANSNYFNPHIPANIDDIYYFDIEAIDARFISDVSKIGINIIYKKVKYKKEVKETLSVVGLLSRYRCHKEVIKDILNKKRIYNQTYLNSLKNQVSILSGVNTGELKATIFGTYFNHTDYFKRPFSKLTSDILKSKHI